MKTLWTPTTPDAAAAAAGDSGTPSVPGVRAPLPRSVTAAAGAASHTRLFILRRELGRVRPGRTIRSPLLLGRLALRLLA